MSTSPDDDRTTNFAVVAAVCFLVIHGVHTFYGGGRYTFADSSPRKIDLTTIQIFFMLIVRFFKYLKQTLFVVPIVEEFLKVFWNFHFT